MLVARIVKLHVISDITFDKNNLLKSVFYDCQIVANKSLHIILYLKWQEKLGMQ